MKKLVGVLSSLPITIIGGVLLLLGFIFETYNISFSFDISYLTVILCGLPIYYSAAKKLISNRGISKISSALLISAAMTAAMLISDAFAAGEVAFIMALGEILEDVTAKRAKKGLYDLVRLSPVKGRRVNENGEEMINAEDIRIGDILRVLPGESFPVDGVVICGETSVDQSVITGESLPADKKTGDAAFCGTVNCFGSVDIRATKVGEDSSLGRLIRMVKEAENKKAPKARIADKAASLLVPIALAIAVVTGLVTQDIVRAVTVLVVFCPCALVLATPTAIMAAIGQAAKRGVIIKSGEALEKMADVDTAVFDKTGTITKGRLCVCDVYAAEDQSEEELVLFAASAEKRSEHPLGKAIAAFAKEKGMSLLASENFRMYAGKGIFAQIKGNDIVCGNEGFILSLGINVEGDIMTKLEEFRLVGKACIIVAVNGRCSGIIALSDEIRKDASSAVCKLCSLGMDAVLLTGDNKHAALYFASKAGIKDVHAELLPEDKVKNIVNMMEKGRKVVMTGDGVNDAPALKAADVGIAMGCIGSDIAAQAADIALMNDDLLNIPYLKRLAAACTRTIKLGITLSLVINAAAVVLSVLGILDPTTGALVHNAGSIIVVLIAALLYDKKFN